jgi:hypothetical protein
LIFIFPHQQRRQWLEFALPKPGEICKHLAGAYNSNSHAILSCHSAFLSGIALSRTFFAYLIAEKLHTFSAGQQSEKSFFPLFPLLHFYFLMTHASYLFRRNRTTL